MVWTQSMIIYRPLRTIQAWKFLALMLKKLPNNHIKFVRAKLLTQLGAIANSQIRSKGKQNQVYQQIQPLWLETRLLVASPLWPDLFWRHVVSICCFYCCRSADWDMKILYKFIVGGVRWCWGWWPETGNGWTNSAPQIWSCYQINIWINQVAFCLFNVLASPIILWTECTEAQ